MSLSTSVATPLAVAQLAQSESGGFWFPTQASALAPEIDWIFHFILWISAAFFAVIVFFMVYFAVKYRKRPGHAAERTASHSTSLELAWSIGPGILLVFMFYFGISGYMNMRTPPDDSYEVQVTARKWNWAFTYPNGHTSPDLHVPLDEPIKLVMASDDVLHSFFVPAFRTKMDVVPGRYTKVTFTATEAGEHQIFCTEYCGTKHSDMLAKVIVHPAGEFDRWLQEAGDILKNKTPVEAGQILTKNQGCMACHSVDGTKGIGPSWKDLFGKTESLADGTAVIADENYIRESILEPMAKITAGFAPSMPTYKGKLKDQELTAIIAYLKSLSANAPKDAAPAPAPDAPAPGAPAPQDGQAPAQPKLEAPTK